MKVTLTGPSGTGKSTLAKWASFVYGLPYFEGSAGLTMHPGHRRQLMEEYGWKGSGHQEVISLSNQSPKFGMEFQRLLLDARSEKFSQIPEFITDRSIVDNIAYFWAQVLPHISNDQAEFFLTKALSYLNAYTTHIVFIETRNPFEMGIEVNDSRISNWFYQKNMSNTFKHVLEEYILPKYKGKYLDINIWDLEKRKVMLTDFLG